MVGDAVAAVLWIVPANDAEFVGALRQQWQRIGEAHAGQRGQDRAELAAHFHGRIGLGVKGIDMRRAALHPEENAAFRLRGRGRRRLGFQ